MLYARWPCLKITAEYLYRISQQVKSTVRITNNSQDYAKQSHHEANDGLISNISTGNIPADSNDDASLAVSNNRASHWTHFRNDEELRNVDQGCKDTRLYDSLADIQSRDIDQTEVYHENQDPKVQR